ncbi:MAG: hypothetical protein JWR88_639, partial [Pseudonocardia sp.]|nr:hypothetical protein [Pseudonocardia sp.]
MVYPQALPVRARRQQRHVLAPVLGLIALGICGLVVLGLVTSEVGVGAVIAGAFVALLPVGPVVAAFLWADRWEPEPPRLLLLAFLWGACVATLTALVINSSAALAADSVLGKGSGDLVSATVVAPVVEEAVKGAFLIGLLIWRRREFDGVIDGIVYAGLVAAGFAFTENILYLGRAFAEEAAAGQSGVVLTVLVLRGLFSPFAHPLFTAMTGIGVGIAALSPHKAVRVLAPLAGYLGAVLLHALWNGSAAIGGGDGFLFVYVFVMLPLFAAMITFVILQRRREQRVVAAALPSFAQAGWIAPSEVELLSSLAGRRGWRSAVQRRSGREAAKAVRDYQAAVTELAFLRNRFARGLVDPQDRSWHDELLSTLGKARRRAMGNPEALTAAFQRPPAGWSPPPPP